MEEVIKKFVAPDRTIIVKPVMRARNSMIQDPDHEAFFLFGTSTIDYCLPVDRQNNLINPFESKAEQDWLEKELDLDLNIYKQKDNYWRTFKVKLGKLEKKLNLKNPKDYIEYLVLKTNTLFIAPEGSPPSKATYRYQLTNEEIITTKKSEVVDKKKTAYKLLGKLEESKESMVNFLRVYGKKVSPASKDAFLQAELDKIISEDIDGFISLASNQEDFELKLLIENAVNCGAVIKDGRKYFLPGGDPLCGEGLTPTIGNVLEYLKTPMNQDIYITLKTRVENAKE